MAQVLCPGCNKAVSLNGLAGHIQKTTNLRCRTVHDALRAPAAFHATGSSLASIRDVSSFLNPDQFSEFGANHWPQAETDRSMHTQEGKLITIRVRSNVVTNNMYISGPYAVPNTDMTEIDANAMEADSPQSNAEEANTICSDAFDENAYDAEDAFEQDLLDTEASETESQGKKSQLHGYLYENLVMTTQ